MTLIITGCENIDDWRMFSTNERETFSDPESTADVRVLISSYLFCTELFYHPYFLTAKGNPIVSA